MKVALAQYEVVRCLGCYFLRKIESGTPFICLMAEDLHRYGFKSLGNKIHFFNCPRGFAKPEKMLQVLPYWIKFFDEKHSLN
jgi:hypothetical protein